MKKVAITQTRMLAVIKAAEDALPVLLYGLGRAFRYVLSGE